MPANNLNKWADEDDEFRRAYETAKSFVAFRREEFLSAELLHVKAYDLNAGVYDKLTNRHRRDEAKFDSNLKKEETKEYSAADKLKLDMLFNQVTSSQSDRKIATSSAVSENKS